MKYNGWGLASGIYNALSSLVDIVIGIAVLIVYSSLLDIAQEFFSFVPELANLTWFPILLSIYSILNGVWRMVIAYGLFTGRNWARIMAIIIHLSTAMSNLIVVVGLLQIGFIGTSILPILIIIANITLLVGMFLRSTVDIYSGNGMNMNMGRQTQIAPPMNTSFAFVQAAPTQAAPPPPQPAPPSNTSYVEPRKAGVARTEVAGPTSPQVIAWLVERNGPRPGKEHRLAQQITIGRDPSRCEIVLDDAKISGEHARIRFEQGRYILFDLASTNHVYVNNQEVQKHALRDGDLIKLGPNVQLTFMQADRI
ncbi:FHA domain-containing protein [Candidatus Chloroploca asiatica]|uniref:FHA domain-containing protein n=1 Tax=Candidatus Chloroploca asiatica TaxID=1506545 RepID=A0A2H3KLF0_9CHLR|nr:FHA domain-containing protein [Candidatus Chloroploca asiatica]PDV98107.1 hypothetical protein A9Q02_03230 [Candidatus Chloroploca asiatica]